MLTVLAHAGQPVRPHDLWTAWSLDPLVLGGLAFAGWVLWRNRIVAPADRRPTYLGAGLAVIAVAVVSPLDAMAGSLASAHMVQHILLVLVAAPLVALGAPATLATRTSPALRRISVDWRRRLGLSRRRLRWLRHPVVVWLLHVATLWFWHASGPYDLAVRNDLVHAAEHLTFLVTGVLFWRIVIGPAAAGRVPNGLGFMLLFATSLQSVLLSALLTFATTPWYASYAATTDAWGLSRLDDQHLAGVIMWVPAGLVYVGVALFLMLGWLRTFEAADDDTSLSPVPNGPPPRP